MGKSIATKSLWESFMLLKTICLLSICGKLDFFDYGSEQFGV